MKLIALLALTLLACPKPAPPIFVPPPDAGTPDDPALADTPCGLACETLRSFPCPEGFRSPGGISCVQICISFGTALNPSCVARASSKTDLAACGVRCRQ